MSVVGERTQYLNLEQIEAACARVAERLLVDDGTVIPSLRRELTALSANGLRSSALGQGLFGPHAPRPGVLALAGPGGVGKTYFAELLARVIYGERFNEHLIAVNCRAYFAGRFPPLPRAKLETGPLAIISLDGVEVLPELPPVAALWADAIRYGRASLPAADEHGEVHQVELSLARTLIVATANVAREQAIHIGFRPEDTHPVGQEESSRLIRGALSTLFEGSLNEVFVSDRWIILPPLDRGGMRRLVDLQLEVLAELLPSGSPAIEIEEAAAARLIQGALASRSPNKTVALVDLIRALIEPSVDIALLEAAAPIPLRVRVSLESGALKTSATPVR
jgi:DNA polymerase III delta prime subunit